VHPGHVVGRGSTGLGAFAVATIRSRAIIVAVALHFILEGTGLPLQFKFTRPAPQPITPAPDLCLVFRFRMCRIFSCS
jgi:hypothetical protein